MTIPTLASYTEVNLNKEKGMPDLQSELQKFKQTITDWDAHEQAIRQPQQPQEKPMDATSTFKPTGNMSHDIFNYVKGGLWTPPEVTHALTKLGYSRVSVSSLIAQMKRKGMVRLEDGYLVTDLASYVPVGRPYGKKKSTKAKKIAKPTLVAKPAKPTQQGIAALKVDAAPVVHTTWDADTVIANIGIKEAYKLYEELSKYFGKRG